jgi:hypothetical protein
LLFLALLSLLRHALGITTPCCCSLARHDRSALDHWMPVGVRRCCSSRRCAPLPSAISSRPVRCDLGAAAIDARVHALLLLVVVMRFPAGARISAAAAGLCEILVRRWFAVGPFAALSLRSRRNRVASTPSPRRSGMT